MGGLMHPFFYENEFQPTSIEQVEYVRSPYYDLSKSSIMNGADDVHETLDQIGMKFTSYSAPR